MGSRDCNMALSFMFWVIYCSGTFIGLAHNAASGEALLSPKDMEDLVSDEFVSGFRKLLEKKTALNDTVESRPTLFGNDTTPTPIITAPPATPITTPVTTPTTPVTTPTTPVTTPTTPITTPTTPVTTPTTPITTPTTPITTPTTPVTTPTTPVTTPTTPITTPTTPVTTPTTPVTTPTTPVTTPTTPVAGQSWCMAKTNVPSTSLQVALDYACGLGGADCGPIQQGGACYDPDTVEAHASYAFNSYYQKNHMAPGTCDFGGNAVISTTDPSYGQCVYPLAATSASTGSPSVLNSTTPTGGIIGGVPVGLGPGAVSYNGTSSGGLPSFPYLPTTFTLLSLLMAVLVS